MRTFSKILLSMGMLTAFAFSLLVSQEQKSVMVEKDVRVPDSLKGTLAEKVDQDKIRNGWGKLKKGMSMNEIKVLLGKPTGIRYQADDNSTTWQYGKRSVIFDYLKKTVRYWEK